MVAKRLRLLASVVLMPFTLVVLPADVTVRYKTEFKVNPGLPPQVAEAAIKGAASGLGQDKVLQLQAGRGFSTLMGYGQIIDFSTRQVTILDSPSRRYAKLKSDQMADVMAQAMPEVPAAARAAAASVTMEVTPTRLTGRTAVIQGVEAEEREFGFSFGAKTAAVRMAMQVWTAKPGEAARLDAVRQMAEFRKSSIETMHSAGAFGQMMKQYPGLAAGFETLMKDMSQDSALMRMHLTMHMPAVAAMLSQMPGANPPPAFNPEDPFMEINQEVSEISTAPVPDSVFQVPEDYQEVPAVDLFRGMLAKPQVVTASRQDPATPSGDFNSLITSARSARSAHDGAAAEKAYTAALERAIADEKPRITQAAVEVATFYVEQRQPEKAAAALRKALEAQEAAGLPAASTIPVMMRLREVTMGPNADTAEIDGRLVKAWESLAGPESVVLASNLVSLSGSLQRSGRLAEAEPSIQRALAILEKHYGPDAPSVGFALNVLASIESSLGKTDLAREARTHEATIRSRTPAQTAARVGAGITPPIVKTKREPEYSESARKAKIQGSILLALVVGADGTPEDIVVLRPLGEGLDEKAVETVKNWRFSPASKDGKPMAVQATLEINFRLL